jgi:SAM-dependent methyltransferase
MKCTVCESPNVEVVFRLEGAPRYSQKILTKEETQKGGGRVDVDLYGCKDCGMIQIDPKSMQQADDYWDDYLNSRAATELYVQYDRMLADNLAHRYKLKGKHAIEIGSGDGYFVAELAKRGVLMDAIEPSAKACEAAKQYGVNSIHTYLDENIGNKVPRKYDGFVSKQVMDLLPDANTFLRDLGRILNPGAVGLIDVPSWSKTVMDKRYYSVLPDRVGYYTASTLTTLLERNNYHVLEVFHGAEDEYVGAYAVYQGEKDGLMKSFKRDFSDFNSEFKKLIANYKASGKTLAGWGAGAKGVTVFAFTNVGPDTIKYVIDRDKNRWGGYMPASLIPVVAPDTLKSQPVDGMIITAAMFYKEIVRDLIKGFGFKGDMIVLSPVPRVLDKKEIDEIMNG